MSEKDLYEILGVGKTATKDEIKKAFRKEAHKYHPDKPTGDEQKFKEVNAAYQILSDDNKRAQYDQFGSAAFSQGAGAPPGGFNWADFAQGTGGGGGVQFDFGDLGDIMGDLFGGGRGRRSARTQGSQRGEDLEYQATLTFEEAAFGVTKSIKIKHLVKCDHCSGNGAQPGTKIIICETCKGQGQINKMQRTFLGNIQTTTVCPTCRGEGKTAEQKCKQCNGNGIEEKINIIEVEAPAGINNNEAIKINGKGNAGRKGGASGDLYIVFRVRAHKEFIRHGYETYAELNIPFSLAALGGKIKVPTIHGEVLLRIPAGTQYGHKFKLTGKGIQKLNNNGIGDHIVEVKVKVPEKLDRKQKKLLEEFADISGDIDNENKGFWNKF